MTTGNDAVDRVHDRWARFRFGIVGRLLSAPPRQGCLTRAIKDLSGVTWKHPVTGEDVRFSAVTIERWFYRARNSRNPVEDLRKALRRDSGTHPAIGKKLIERIVRLYEEHRSWSYQLLYENLRAEAVKDDAMGSFPSYSTVRRFMRSRGLIRRKRKRGGDRPGALLAEARLETRETRSYEMEHVNALWHTDFHHGSIPILLPTGEWVRPILFAVIDDFSRLCCHAQWYLAETSENLTHGLCQAFEKRGLPPSLMNDNGAAMIAAEVKEGHERLSILQEFTLPYSPHQNAKQENFWARVEAVFLAMCENCENLMLAELNRLLIAWVELGYNRKVHGEIGTEPLTRFLSGKDLARPCPSSEDLRLAFTMEVRRVQRRSDGTVTAEGRRFEIPSRYRHLQTVGLRYARWDLGRVYLSDLRTGKILDRLYPLDKAANADGKRRTMTTIDEVGRTSDPVPKSGMAPLLRQYLEEYESTGLPPAYQPKDEIDGKESKQ